MPLGGDSGRVHADGPAARRDARKGEGDRRHHQHQQRRKSGAAEDEAEKAAVHVPFFGSSASRRYVGRQRWVDASVSALQSSCGIWGAGVGLPTRALTAMMVLGATK